jgi:hypothetical protein
MNLEVTKKIEEKLAAYRTWRTGQQFQTCRLVQYCGSEMIGAIDVSRSEIEAQIQGLLAEGFYADWICHDAKLYLREWEFGGAEPEWRFVYAETDLPSA